MYYLSRLPFTSIEISQQSKVTVGEFLAVLLQETLAISWVDGRKVAAVHCRPALSLSQNQRHQLPIRIDISRK